MTLYLIDSDADSAWMSEVNPNTDRLLEVVVCYDCGSIYVPGTQCRDMGAYHWHRG